MGEHLGERPDAERITNITCGPGKPGPHATSIQVVLLDGFAPPSPIGPTRLPCVISRMSPKTTSSGSRKIFLEGRVSIVLTSKKVCGGLGDLRLARLAGL